MPQFPISTINSEVYEIKNPSLLISGTICCFLRLTKALLNSSLPEHEPYPIIYLLSFKCPINWENYF